MSPQGRRSFLASLALLFSAPLTFGRDRRVYPKLPRIPYTRWGWGRRGVLLAPEDMRAWPRYPVCRYQGRQSRDALAFVPPDPRRVEFLTPDGWVFERRGRSWGRPDPNLRDYKSPAMRWWERWLERPR